jgi:signal transduction histidine kinase/CheY-like chemotaxis protein
MQLSMRSLRLRTWLTILAAGCIILSLSLAGLVGWLDWTEQKRQTTDSFVATSRAILGAVDREIDQATALARGLSASLALAKGDMAEFDREARGAAAPYDYFVAVIAVGDGRHLVNTQLPAGELPDIRADPGFLRDGTLAGAMTVKPLARSLASGKWVVGVRVPVRIGGAVTYLVDIVIPAAIFQKVIDEQRFPKDWQSVVFDNAWTIVARLVEPEKWVGNTGAMSELQHDPSPVITGEARLLGGDYFLTAWVKSPRFGWTASIGIPVYSLFWQSFPQLALIVILTFAVCFVSIATVGLFTVRLVRSIQKLALASNSLGRDEPIDMPRFFVKELDCVGEAIAEAGHRLSTHRRMLEDKIREVSDELRREAEERVNAEVTMTRMQRLESLGQLTGGVAHDFNNLLTVVIAQSERILFAAKANESITQMATSILKVAERGAHLTAQLLAFSRRQNLKPDTVSVHRLLGELGDLLRRAAGEAITVSISADPDLWPSLVDAAQFEAAIINLVVNARDAMPAGGLLAIESRNEALSEADAALLDLAPGEYVVISVIDTGVGMSPETQQRCFEPFYTTKDVGKGTGLGLSQVYGFVRQSHGMATVESAPGCGTTVAIYLPRAYGEPEQKAVRVESVAPAGNGRVVLVVEDQEDVRELLESYLAECGYSTLSAADGVQARQLLESSNRIEVMLTDVVMPNGLDGITLGRIARELRPELKVVLMSGYSRQTRREEDFLFIEKPFRQAELAKLVADSLRDCEPTHSAAC